MSSALERGTKCEWRTGNNIKVCKVMTGVRTIIRYFSCNSKNGGFATKRSGSRSKINTSTL